jgi:5-carboxymethyl-2-hydroxymuconate isomerase
MPQLILEYSANILEKQPLEPLLQECNLLLVKFLPTELKACKSRAVEHLNYCIGNGAAQNAFVHINLKIMPGRSTKTKQATGQELLQLLKQYFSQSYSELNLQITVEITELAEYFKITNQE